MDKFFLSLNKRILFPIVAIGGLALWLFMCDAHYESYWNGTIYRVQTTDFNLLHHTLPSTLSQLIISGRDDLVQEVLDSNYGIFGLVVTDPSGQSVLYKTGKTYRRESWQEKASPDDLLAESKHEPFDVLTDPPPLEPVWEHKSPRANKATQIAGASNPARRVIGHLYYLRPAPPSFFEDMSGFFSTGMSELSGAKRGYLYLTFSCVLFSLVLMLSIWLRLRVLSTKQLELDHVQRELDIRKKALEHLTTELSTQKSRKYWLEKEADESYKRAFALKQALERLRDSLTAANGGEVSRGAAYGQPSPYVRPAMHPASSLLEEIELLIPALTDNAGTLKSQANLLHDYCAMLEQRQTEMKKFVDNAYTRAQLPANLIDMAPR